MSDGKEFPSDKADKFVVRFPDGMREKIRAAAEANNRSMNAEIIARLQDSFAAEDGLKHPVPAGSTMTTRTAAAVQELIQTDEFKDGMRAALVDLAKFMYEKDPDTFFRQLVARTGLKLPTKPSDPDAPKK